MMNPIYRKLLLIGLGMGAFLLPASQNHQAFAGNPQSPTAGVPAKWTRNLPFIGCTNSSDPHCQNSSPALADVTNDGQLDIVLATNNGHVIVLEDDGTDNGHVVWNVDIASAFGLANNDQIIRSSPAVADIDADGRMEIVVGVGETFDRPGKWGGVIVLEHNGQVKANWPQLALREQGAFPSIYSSPALGDVDNDGDMEIFAGGFDKRLWAWHHDGTPLAGFPPDSALLDRLGWENLNGGFGDVMWASPALADLDWDGHLDVIIPTGEGNFDDRWPGDTNGWTCPFSTAFSGINGMCGGNIYAFNYKGELLPGFPRWIHEALQSSPAIADITGDGYPEMITGTGDWFYRFSPDHPQYGFNLLVWDSVAHNVDGWMNRPYGYGKATGSTVNASPVIGDIAGDSQPEILVPVMDKKLYAWHLDGTLVAGFPMRPRTALGDAIALDVGSSLVLADYDGDAKMEIFLNQGWGVTVIDGNGSQLTTSTNGADGKPFYWMAGSVLNNPAVGDVDNDGKPELVAFNNTLYVWDLPATARLDADWPQFKYNAAGTSYPAPAPTLLDLPENIFIWHERSGVDNSATTLPLYKIGLGTLEGRIVAEPTNVNITGVPFPIGQAGTYELGVQVTSLPATNGWTRMGNIVLDTWSDDEPTPVRRRITVHLFIGDEGDVKQLYLPIMTGNSP